MHRHKSTWILLGEAVLYSLALGLMIYGLFLIGMWCQRTNDGLFGLFCLFLGGAVGRIAQRLER